MHRSEDIRVDPYLKKKRGRKTWQKIVRVLACIVVFCTTYALILPAITMEKDAYCGREEHTHTSACYTVGTTAVQQIICELEQIEEHAHAEECYAPAHTHTDECYQIPESELVCAKEETEDHAHTDECYMTGEPELVCGLEEREAEELLCTIEETEGHTHSEECCETVTVEGEETLTCGMEVHTHTDSCYVELDKGERAEVESVIDMIDAMPSADEIDAKIAEFEAAGDTKGETEWLTETCQQVAKVHFYYNQLTEEQKALVSNADKLLELEYIWSAVTLDLMGSVTVYQVNQYDSSTSSVLVSGGTVKEVIGTGMDFAWWTAVIVDEGSDGQMYVTEIVSPGTGMDKRDLGPQTDGGFVLLVHTDIGTPDAQVGDPVTVSFSYQSAAYSSSGLGTVNFNSLLKPAKDNTGKLDIVDSADTSEFIEVNLYDFGSNINDLYSSNNNYPGFQQDFGTEKVGTSFGASSFNFGNNITADLDAGISSITNAGGDINKTASTFGGVNYGVANIPLEDVMKKTLLNGYPAMADGTSLSYLFTTGTYATKQNSASINGLFQYNSATGAYKFNSRENHAQFDAATNTFTLYKQIISSNFIMYPFGNFLPFNDITEQSTQASTIDRSYFVTIAQSALYRYNQGAGDEYGTLGTQLNNFIALMDASYGTGWDAYDATNAYFGVRNINQSFSETSPTLPDGQPLMNYVYSIDYDEATDFYFGMEIKMNFIQPKNGFTGLTGKEPMEFYFTGDDDVWIYVDGVLFLDLSGIHRHVGGEIDFVNGKINYYNLDTATGDVATTPYKTVTFEDVFREAYAEGSAELAAVLTTLNEKGTFTDYSAHSFNFYYMERGAGSGVCRMNFNFPLLRQNSISVSKEVTADTEILGDPEYKFQVLKANSDGTKTNTLFIAAGTEYNIYDSTDNLIGTDTTDENGVFTLKAGQRAEFSGIKENAGKYYVRELLEGTVLEQYGNVTVSGQSSTTSGSVTVDSDTFTGMDSPVKDMSDGATAFRFTNDVDESKLAEMNISKVVTEYDGVIAAGKTFDIQVKLDGEALAVGTKYTVGTETRLVTTEGIITIKAGETAVISGILAGTEFAVQETSGSAKGYTVTYTDSGGYTITIKDGAATGVIKTSANVQLVVTNTEKGATVVIPGTKALTAYDGAEHSFTFELTEVTDQTGAYVKEGGLSGYTATATVQDGAGSFEFSIAYGQVDMEALPAKFYYCVTEQGNADSLANTTLYVVEVTVSETAEGIAAEITKMWKDGTETDERSADFINTLAGLLTLSKTVSGGSTDAEFSFTITLAPGTSCAALPTSYPAIFYQQDGTEEETTVTLNGSNQIVLSGFKHGERAVIQGIPYGVTWTIEETNSDGYKVTTNVTAEGNATSGSGSMVSGSIVTGDTAVAYTNTMGYRLPETGGAGTTLYTMSGLGLMLLALCLMYSHRRRRKEDDFP